MMVGSSKPLNILIVSQYFWPENFRINDFAAALVEKGHNVTVLTGKPNYPHGSFFKGYSFWGRFQEIHSGIKILRAPLFPRGSGHGLSLILNYFSFVFFGILFGAPRVLFKKYDFIFVHQLSPITIALPGIFIKWMKRVPLYMWVQDLWPESLSATGAVKSKRILSLVGSLVDFIYGQCDVLFVQSKGFTKSLSDRGVDKNKIIYMPNWAENLFAFGVTKEINSVPMLQGDFKIIFAGNIGEAQDFPTILSAASILKNEPQIQFFILGDGRKKEWVRSEIARLGLEKSVHLLGQYPLETMPAFFKQAEALLVSLKKDPIFALTIPSKVQSYLASGKPILASLDGEGAKVIIDSDSGYACPSESPHELAQNIKKLVSLSPEERRLLGLNGQKYFENHFTQALIVSSFINTVHDQLKQKN